MRKVHTSVTELIFAISERSCFHSACHAHTWIGPTLEETRQTILAPIELRAKVQLEKTNLVSRMFESWGEIPIAPLQQMDWRNSLYGYIGLEDYTMYPFLRPGSV